MINFFSFLPLRILRINISRKKSTSRMKCGKSAKNEGKKIENIFLPMIYNITFVDCDVDFSRNLIFSFGFVHFWFFFWAWRRRKSTNEFMRCVEMLCVIGMSSSSFIFLQRIFYVSSRLICLVWQKREQNTEKNVQCVERAHHQIILSQGERKDFSHPLIYVFSSCLFA